MLRSSGDGLRCCWSSLEHHRDVGVRRRQPRVLRMPTGAGRLFPVAVLVDALDAVLLQAPRAEGWDAARAFFQLCHL